MRNFTDAIKDGLKYNPSSAYVRIFDARIFLWTRICPVNADPEIYIQGRAKTAIILFTVALASELQIKHVDSVSLHPGCKGFPKYRVPGIILTKLQPSKPPYKHTSHKK